jgi:hypothetical protein
VFILEFTIIISLSILSIRHTDFYLNFKVHNSLHSDFTFYRRVSATLGLFKLRGKGTDFYLLFLDKNVFNGL